APQLLGLSAADPARRPDGSGRLGVSAAPGLLALFPLGEASGRDQVVPLLELDEADPLGIPADGRDVCRVEADDHTLFGDEHHLFFSAEELYPDHPAVAASRL